jgi:hypothetical protein
MSTLLAEILDIYNALDEGRKALLEDEAQRLLADQRTA